MRKPLFPAIVTVLSAATFSLSVTAQNVEAPQADRGHDPVNLDNIIVTGTRIATSIDKIPGAISVVGFEQVQRNLSITEDATSVLAHAVPGYSESTQAMSNTGETLRGRIALRLFDGVPQGSPLREGNRSGTFTDMGVIGRIEVINGPSAAEGIGGAGGVINYLSRSPDKDGHETTVSTRFGTQFKDNSGHYKFGLTHAWRGAASDVLVSAAYLDRGIFYDGDGRRIGMNTSGSLADTYTKNLFIKGGHDFGEEMAQRVQLTYSHFHIGGKHHYVQVEGCRYDPLACPVPITNTSERGQISGSLAEHNEFEQLALKYTHADIYGGSLSMDLYWADQAMRYLPENGDDRQLVKVDGNFDETGRIFDQSEIVSKKKGLRLGYARAELLNIEGLRVRAGVDVSWDTAAQRLALTRRIWVPPMDYSSLAPYAQLSWDIGPVTLDTGIRREDGELKINGYTTTAYRDFTPVEGGTLDYKANMPNFGAIWRINGQWSVFASWSEGFGIANVGIPLRNINAQSACKAVSCIADLEPLITKNKEIGVNWHGHHGQIGTSLYRSTSEFGSSLSIDPVTEDFILTRAPVEIEGFEFSGAWTFSPRWKGRLLYSRIRGKTEYYPGSGLHREMGVNDISPDKASASLIWSANERFNASVNVTRTFSRDLRAHFVNAETGNAYDNEENTQGHALVDMSAHYDVGRLGTLSLGIENLLNKHYILTWSQVPGWQNYWAGRGRVVSLMHTIKF